MPTQLKKKKREPIPQGVRFDVFRRDNFQCVYCGASSPDVTLHCDHRVAVANGGTNDMSNLVTACSDCNYGKGVKRVGSRRQPAANDNGLVGLFGHRLDDDGAVHNQFQIRGMSGEDTCVIQLFSFLDGSPTNVELVDVAELRTDRYRLYATEDQLNLAYWQDKEARGLLHRKTAQEAFEMSMWFSRKIRGAA